LIQLQFDVGAQIGSDRALGGQEMANSSRSRASSASAATAKRPSTRALSEADYRRLAQFRYALRQFLHFSDDAAAHAGLSPQQYQALVVVRGFAGEGPPSVGDLAEWLLIEHHSAVGLVDRLAAAGLIVRGKEVADGRRVTLVLTEKAQELLAGLVDAHRAELRRLIPLIKPLLSELDH
jgi:DNA-binding MarR family transcriptional regulator